MGRFHEDKNLGPASFQWTHPLCECHRPLSCYVCCCPHFVFARARRWHDGTDTLFNCLCVSLPVMHQIIRRDNGIDGTSREDCVEGCCLYPCSAVRAYREVINRSPKVAAFEGSNHWGSNLADCIKGPHLQNCFVTFCMPCAFAKGRRVLDDSSFLFNLFCLSPCAFRNIVRRAYGIRGSHCTDALMCLIPPLGCMDACRIYRTVIASGTANQRHRQATELRRWGTASAPPPVVMGPDGRPVIAGMDFDGQMPVDPAFDRARNLTYGPELVCGQLTVTGCRCLCRVSQETIRQRAEAGELTRCECGHPTHLHPTERVLAATVGPHRPGIPLSAKQPYEGGLIVTELRHPEARNDALGDIADLPGFSKAPRDRVQY
eukprot:TRINITY_DN1958_c0_g2_i1.p1 TRINITY_DN1958_c0_g2~~TRINITY_DN1958_c0_g2_i1.p1  ORF type:complete len:375 (+),score=46.77 TRINITY_DN1958_c0_g2_i1:130-1254(+)